MDAEVVTLPALKTPRRGLTMKQLEVVELIHLDNHEIAKILGTTKEAIDGRVKNACRRLAVTNKVTLALESCRLGLIKVAPGGKAESPIE